MENTVEKPACKPFLEVDFEYTEVSSFAIVYPLTPAARAGVDQNVPPSTDCTHYLGGVVVEPRYLEQFLKGITDAGFTVEGR